MADDRLVREVASRAGVPRETARAVLDALEALEPRRGGGPPGRVAPVVTGQAYDEDGPEVRALIAHAEAHPLGTEFLRHGYPESVAVIFQTSPLVVHAARQRLSR